MTTGHGDEHDLGLQHDLQRMLTGPRGRRQVLSMILAGSVAAFAAACNSGSSETTATGIGNSSGSDGTGNSGSNGSSGTGSCLLAPEETAGPYPGDGSNTRNGSVVNVLNQSGVVRSDITGSFGPYSGVAAGVPLTLTLQLVDFNNLCAPLEGYVVYLWHCTRDGNYSLYSNGVQEQNFLRGVQVADANGGVTFDTIFPGCYSGRYPHIHFEIYPNLDMASLYANKVQTSQIALPRGVCETVYASATGYGQSSSNLAGITIATDNVFRDNTSDEIDVMTPLLSGDLVAGFDGTVVIGVPGI